MHKRAHARTHTCTHAHTHTHTHLGVALALQVGSIRLIGIVPARSPTASTQHRRGECEAGAKRGAKRAWVHDPGGGGEDGRARPVGAVQRARAHKDRLGARDGEARAGQLEHNSASKEC